MAWELGGLAAWVALVTSIATGNLLVGNLAEVAGLIVVPTILVPVGAVQLMKLANRAAQRRIAAGEFPGLGLSDADPAAHADAALTDGSAS